MQKTLAQLNQHIQTFSTSTTSFHPIPNDTTSVTNMSPSPHPSPSNNYLFNPSSLPSNVQARYKKNRTNHFFTKHELDTPYSHGNAFYYEDQDQIFLSDGTLFIHQTPDEKRFCANPPICLDTSPSGLRQWYHLFMRTAMDYGFYIHPFLCFRQNYGFFWFNVGPAYNDDLPQRLELTLLKNDPIIYQVITQDKIWRGDTSILNLFQQSYGHGYRALKLLINKIHPNFQLQPAIMISQYPSQSSSQSWLEYKHSFMDFLQLRAYIQNISTSLHHPHEIDIFIHNAQHNDFLNRITMEDHNNPNSQHKYQPDTLIDTLEQYLSQPYSPTYKLNKPCFQGSSHKSFSHSTRSYSPPQKFSTPVKFQKPTPVHILQHDNNDNPDDILPTIDDLCNELSDIEVPHDDKSHHIFDQYSAKICRIRTATHLPSSPRCVICNNDSTHPFEDCPIHKNTDFLRQHYIKFCRFRQIEKLDQNKIIQPISSPMQPREQDFYMGQL
jgi:hypothetical protein